LQLDTFPRLYRFFDTDQAAAQRERRVEERSGQIDGKLTQMTNAARQIFAVAVETVREMSEMIKVLTGDKKEWEIKLENYKVHLGKYHGILLQDLKGPIA
jgi:hypothetical protein